MKKVITILAIMIVAACAVFAADGDKLNLVSAVGKLPPVIKIRAVDNASATKVGAQAAVDVATGLDIAEQNIVWDFTIYQEGNNVPENDKAYARYNKLVEITLTLGSFTGVNTKVVANDTPAVTSITAGTPGTGAKLVLAANGTTSLKATYSGKVNDQVLGTFKCTWTKDETLPDDTYKALVTLNYTVS